MVGVNEKMREAKKAAQITYRERPFVLYKKSRPMMRSAKNSMTLERQVKRSDIRLTRKTTSFNGTRQNNLPRSV